MKTWLKKILVILAELAIISGALWFIAEKRGIHDIRQITPLLEDKISSIKVQPFPELNGYQQRNFAWMYKGKKYDLTLDMYDSAYQYYANQPKSYVYSGQLPDNWEENYYGMFLKSNEKDQTLRELTGKLQSLGVKNNLSDDQVVELTLAFVQSIQYDDAKAKNILAQIGNETMLYPYELLYSQKGVCSDKSLLAISILRQMGYGTAIFAYEQDNHMAIGIKCPKSYSTYGSGYCFAETTSVGNKIGIIPQFNSQSNKTEDVKELTAFDQSQAQSQNLKNLGQMTIYQVTDGKEYDGIIETKKIEGQILQVKNDMNSLLAQLDKQKAVITKEQTDLKSQKDDLDAMDSAQNIEKYNAAVEQYNNLVEKYKKDTKTYNQTVALYNQEVGRYNILIKQ